jgi:DNA-binding transcriptional ArsR family regulator
LKPQQVVQGHHQAEVGGDDPDLLIALRHPLRRRILTVAKWRDVVSPRALADELREPLSNVSYHVRVLADCKAVTLVYTKPVRGSMQHFYRFSIAATWALDMLGLSGPESGRDEGEGRTHAE